MEHPNVDFDLMNDPIETRISVGLRNIATALKSEGWKSAGAEGLTPTQGQTLALLKNERAGLRLSELAAALGVTSPTASDVLGSLVTKGHVERGVDPVDRRAAAFRLTPSGEEIAGKASEWPAFLATAVECLEPDERTALYRSIIKIIRTLQETGAISIQRMCLSCRYFQPNVRPDDPVRPHVCALVGAPFGDNHLRLDCREHERASDPEREIAWRRFANPSMSTGAHP